MPVNATDTLSGVVDLYGSTVNGRDPALTVTDYRVDICPGDDFFSCDQTPLAWQGTGISGPVGFENALLGSLDTTALNPGRYTLRLMVNSVHTATGRSQVVNDFYSIRVAASAVVPLPADPAPGSPPAESVPEAVPPVTDTLSAASGGGGCVWRHTVDGPGEGDWIL